jgi:hypothetical protein
MSAQLLFIQQPHVFPLYIMLALGSRWHPHFHGHGQLYRLIIHRWSRERRETRQVWERRTEEIRNKKKILYYEEVAKIKDDMDFKNQMGEEEKVSLEYSG